MRPGLLLGKVIKAYEGDKTGYVKKKVWYKMYYFSPCYDQVHDKHRKGGRVYFTRSSTGVESMVAGALGQEVERDVCWCSAYIHTCSLILSDVFCFVVCVCLHVCMCTIMQIPTEARRGCWIWSWIYRQL